MNKNPDIVNQELLDKIIVIVRQAGEIVRSFWGKSLKQMDKADKSFATEADLASEKFLIEELGKLVPDAGFIAEESGESGVSHEGFGWVIDPLDGTTNFAHGFPYFSIAVALTYDDVPLIGVVFNPAQDELFYAMDGAGAYKNDQKIQVSEEKDVNRLVVAVGVPCSSHDCDSFWDRIRPVFDTIHTYRKLGSAALDFAGVASGRLSGALHSNIKWWDVAAGIVLVREAGGKISEFDKNTIGRDFSSCIASNPYVFEKLKGLIS